MVLYTNSLKEFKKEKTKLTKEQELELGWIMKNNPGTIEAQEAHDTLLKKYINYAHSWAHSLSYRASLFNYELEDLMQDSLLVLSNLIWYYKPERNCVLSTHLHRNMKRDLCREILKKAKTIKVPMSAMSIAEYMNNKAKELNQPEINSIVIDYCVKEKNWDRQELVHIASLQKGLVSLDMTIGEGENTSELYEFVSSKDSVIFEVENKTVRGRKQLLSLIEQIENKEDRDLISYEAEYKNADIPFDTFLKQKKLTKAQYNRKIKSITKLLIEKAKEKKVVI